MVEPDFGGSGAIRIMNVSLNPFHFNCKHSSCEETSFPFDGDIEGNKAAALISGQYSIIMIMVSTS